MAEKEKDTRRFASRLIKDVVLDAEKAHQAKVVTWTDQSKSKTGVDHPGGQCSCCGLSPRIDGLFDYWLVMKAGLSDSDGVYYSMLCIGDTDEGCLGSIRRENAKRKPTIRDEAAAIVSDLMGDDLDGAEAFMDDLEFLGEFD